MNRIWITVIVCAIPSSLLGQCSLNGPDPRFPPDIVASAIGQKGFRGVAFTLRVPCPGEPNAHVRLKLDTNVGTNRLTVSPSEGITPLEVQVGVNPNRVAYFSPGSGVGTLYFSTVDLNPALTPSVSVRLTITKPDLPVISSVVNAASLAPVITPGAVVLIRGSSLGPTTSHAIDKIGVYPTSLGNMSVTFNGIPAALMSSSPKGIQAVVPYGIAGAAEAQVVVTHQKNLAGVERSSSAFSVPVTGVSLGIFNKAQSVESLNWIRNCDANGCTPNGADNPAPRGSIITIFATGVAPWAGPSVDGAINTVPRSRFSDAGLSIGGQPARILWAGTAPYQVWGVFQVNALVPENIASGPQAVVLSIDQATNATQQVTVVVQ